MNLEQKNVHYIVYTITVIYLLYRIMYKPSTQYVAAFVLIAAINFVISRKIISSLLLAIVFCVIWEVIYPKKNKLLESMKMAKREEIMEKFDDDDRRRDNDDNPTDSYDDDIEDFSDYEGFEDASKKDTPNKPEEDDNQEDIGNNDTDENFTDDAGEGVTEPYLDVGRSFLEAYKNLSPKQIEGLTFDTKELLTTQQKLIETLNTIGPTLKEGKNILDTFKDYFVEDNKK